MTSERPKVVITRGRTREAQKVKNFTFTRDMVRLDGQSAELQAFRTAAWEVYEATPMPTTKEEPWRRTDLAGLAADQFTIPGPDAYLDLPAVPEEIMTPMTGDSQAGRLVLLPGGGAQAQLSPELARKGVVFTDLRTAEREHPELLARLIGQVVKPSEGKFAALA
ncbi:MAG TPA: hypothetical protein PLV53_12160, partial [Anaerolineaceae bacterium]|nr:hypothetical protein [Anaerolineaceae bacterium]